MTLMNKPFINPPVDSRLYLSNAQTVTANGKSTNTYDAKAAYCFPKGAYLVIEPVTLGTGESITITPQQDTASDLSSSPSTVGQAQALTSSTTSQTIIPLSNNQITQRYFGLDFSNVGTGDSIPVTAYLVPIP